MDREIKFRGKRVDTGEWVYGDLVRNCLNIASNIINVGIKKENSNTVEVDPETVGQFTGLKDSKGVEIYEGDVLRIRGEGYYSNNTISLDDEWEYIGKVSFKVFSWFVGLIDSGVLFYDLLEEAPIDDMEVIGNIFENPELLEAKP